MKDKKNDLLQGTLDLLVLKSLALGPLHGLGVSNRIAQILATSIVSFRYGASVRLEPISRHTAPRSRLRSRP